MIDVRIALVLLAVPAAAVLRAWLRYRLAAAADRSRNQRLSMALRGTRPEHRAEIITACASLEAASTAPGDEPQQHPSTRGDGGLA